LNVLTPKYNYGRNSNTTNHICVDNFSIFNTSPTISISPNTKSWVSELIKIPSPQISSNMNNSKYTSEKLITKNKLLKKQLYRYKKLLKQKRTIIYLLKKNLTQYFEETNFPSVSSVFNNYANNA